MLAIGILALRPPRSHFSFSGRRRAEAADVQSSRGLPETEAAPNE
jgi:hypothetical protein